MAKRSPNTSTPSRQQLPMPRPTPSPSPWCPARPPAKCSTGTAPNGHLFPPDNPVTRCCSTGQSSTLFMLILKTFLPGDGGAGGAGGGLAHTGTETTPLQRPIRRGHPSASLLSTSKWTLRKGHADLTALRREGQIWNSTTVDLLQLRRSCALVLYPGTRTPRGRWAPVGREGGPLRPFRPIVACVCWVVAAANA